MKQVFTVIATCATLLLASCSKEKSIDSNDPNGPGQVGGGQKGLLVKGILTDGTDSVTTTYGYDAQNRLISQAITATSSNFINLDYKLERNSNGQIKKYEFTSTEFVNLGLDKVLYNVFYDEAKKQYAYKVMEFEVQGIKVKDSTSYTYDNQNRIVKQEGFINNPMTGDYIKTTMTDYGYNSKGDVEKIMNYYFDEDINDFSLYYDVTYEYDDKVNPLVLGNEAILLDTHQLFGTHNVIKQTAVYPEEPGDNLSLSVALTYSAEGKPLTSTITDTNTGALSNFKYFYQ